MSLQLVRQQERERERLLFDSNIESKNNLVGDRSRWQMTVVTIHGQSMRGYPVTRFLRSLFKHRRKGRKRSVWTTGRVLSNKSVDGRILAHCSHLCVPAVLFSLTLWERWHGFDCSLVCIEWPAFEKITLYRKHVWNIGKAVLLATFECLLQPRRSVLHPWIRMSLQLRSIWSRARIVLKTTLDTVQQITISQGWKSHRLKRSNGYDFRVSIDDIVKGRSSVGHFIEKYPCWPDIRFEARSMKENFRCHVIFNDQNHASEKPWRWTDSPRVPRTLCRRDTSLGNVTRKARPRSVTFITLFTMIILSGLISAWTETRRVSSKWSLWLFLSLSLSLTDPCIFKVSQDRDNLFPQQSSSTIIHWWPDEKLS